MTITCDNCSDDLEGKDHVLHKGNHLCASQGRLDELNASAETYEHHLADGSSTLENFVSRR